MLKFCEKKLSLCTLIVCFLIANPQLLVGQISGLITDKKTGEPLKNVDVFINQSTIATVGDEAGQFELVNPPSGFYELVLYKEGYILYKSFMNIREGRAYKLNLSLTPLKVSKITKLTQEQKTVIRASIIGNEYASSAIKILNEEVLVMNNQTEQSTIGAKKALIIQNELTGYQHYFYLMGSTLEDITHAPVRYEALSTADIQQRIAWEKERKNQFIGSTRHWLMALVSNRIKEEGYTMLDKSAREVDGTSFVSTSSLTDYKRVTIQELTVVQHQKGSSSTVVTETPVEVKSNGLLLTPKALVTQGGMGTPYLAKHLPIDYLPIEGEIEKVYEETIDRFYEKIYIHTDKPYYYPGEALWFKGYVNYKKSTWRDSLSKVLYIELINPEREVTLTKTLKIDSGFFHNDFILTDTLIAGNYYLRGYTNLNRNFGDSLLFVKSIPILKSTDKVDYTQAKKETSGTESLLIRTSKEKYRPREKITLSIETKNVKGNPVASHLSISVTDVGQVIPINESQTILNSFSFSQTPNKRPSHLNFPVEYALTFNAKFLNERGVPEKGRLTLLQLAPRNVTLLETDDQGLFSVTGFDFYDSASFSVKSDKAKILPYGKVELLPRETPTMSFPNSANTLLTQNAQFDQRVISEYEVPKDARLLEAIEIKANKVEDILNKVREPIGGSDYVFKEEEINTAYPSILYSMVGKVAGLLVDPVNNQVGFTRAMNQSINFQGGPLVLIDDVPTSGDAGNTLAMINPTSVESISIVKRLNVTYGAMGGSGIIAVYLKRGASIKQATIEPNFQTIKIQGYSSARSFRSPDYSDKLTDTSLTDYRSTIYWNPEVKTDSTTGSVTLNFFAADLIGRYRIVVEGITQKGEPIRSVIYTDVENEN